MPVLLSMSGVVMMKMISSTNARSSNGVTLISESVWKECFCEKRRMGVNRDR